MKSFNRLSVVVLFCMILCFVGCNVYLASKFTGSNGRDYRVQVNRVAADIEDYGWKNVDLSRYPAVLGIYPLKGDRREFFRAEQDYVIRDIDGKIYRIDYVSEIFLNQGKRQIFFGMNIILTVITVLVFGVLFFVRFKILKPFEDLAEIPYTLARGNMVMPLQENKNRFFGKFLWGMNVLRENIEKGKQQELRLQKEKKTLVLSISHDIKTPLAAIKLYAQALSRGLYPDKARQQNIAESINKKVDEIECFVSDIIHASNEDFLSLPVKHGEYLLSVVMQEISEYYNDKLQLIKTEFSVDIYGDCLLRGDSDRVIEVLQNIVENAIKYGDGKWICISVEKEEDCCLISVRNSGCTLSQTELAHIFDSFWRGANAKNVKGSGLGLYICRKLMEKMGGSIFAEIGEGEMCVTVAARKV